MATPNYQMSTAANQTFSAFSFIAFVLVTIPLPWHLEAWNTGTCLYMFWAGIGSFNWFINSVIWNKHVKNVAPIWCDISTRIIIAQSIGIPVASLCINRRLYKIASVKTVTVTKTAKRRAIVMDLAIGLGLPLLELPLAYVTQGHRFNIYEQAGCFPYTHNTPLAFAFVWTWPLIIGLVSAVYCILTLRAFSKRRSRFKELLAANNNLNSNRYFRLMALAGVDLSCTIPMSAYAIAQNISGHIQPWRSWEDTHLHFSRVGLYPALFWRNDRHVRDSIELSRWSTVVCAFIFFALFGFADEARKNYRIAYESFARRVGYSTGSMGSGATSSTGAKTGFPGITSWGKNSVPVFVRKETTQTADMTSSTFSEKHGASMGSVFDDYKVKEFASTTTQSSSISSSSRSPSPSPDRPSPALFTPPNHTADAPTSVQNSHDIV